MILALCDGIAKKTGQRFFRNCASSKPHAARVRPHGTRAQPGELSASTRSHPPRSRDHPSQNCNVYGTLLLRKQRATHKSSNGSNFATPPRTINTATAIFTMRLQQRQSSSQAAPSGSQPLTRCRRSPWRKSWRGVGTAA
jgi:hypothetical protein